MTDPTNGLLSGIPCRAGVAVTRTSLPSAPRSVVDSHTARPRLFPPRRRAPGRVVSTWPALVSSDRPAVFYDSAAWLIEARRS